MPKMEMAERLNATDRKRYRQAKERIKKAIVAGFVVTGQELAAIRDGRLYREEYGTFAEFCEREWDMQRAYAYRLIEAANVVGRLSPIGDILPVTETQCRPLTTIDLEKVGDAWAFVVKRLPENDKCQPILTAKAIKEELQIWKDNEAAVPFTEEELSEMEKEDAIRESTCTNPKCDSTEFDEEGDCVKCHEPAANQGVESEATEPHEGDNLKDRVLVVVNEWFVETEGSVALCAAVLENLAAELRLCDPDT